MKIFNRNVSRRLVTAAAAGFLLGAVWLVAIRFLTVKSDAVHYHANFALYINDRQDTFESPSFYEEVQACSADEHNNPKTRVHMHDNKAHLVHVHAEGVTWSQFFTNLGYVLGDNLIKTDDGIYVDGQDGNQLTYIINGDETGAIANRVIKSEDVLLVNYGKTPGADISSRFQAVTRDAGEANLTKDPATCSGDTELTPLKRLEKAVGF